MYFCEIGFSDAWDNVAAFDIPPLDVALAPKDIQNPVSMMVTDPPPQNETDWIEIDPLNTPGTFVDFFGQSGQITADLNGDGILFNSPGEFVAFYDSATDTSITYAAFDDSGEPGTVTGGSIGEFGLVIGASHGSNGHTFVSGGIGTPGAVVYVQGTNNIQGLSTGWSTNYQLGVQHGAFTTSGAFGTGAGSYGTPSISQTYGIDLTTVLHDVGNALARAWKSLTH